MTSKVITEETAVQLLLGGWYPMHCAPRDTRWIEVQLIDESVKMVHYACDLSGEYQPCFEGWFEERTGCNGFFQVRGIVAWRPIK